MSGWYPRWSILTGRWVSEATAQEPADEISLLIYLQGQLTLDIILHS